MTRWSISLPEDAGGGETVALVDRALREERGAVVLGHGAGTSAEHATMEALAGALTHAGLTCVRFDFPYRRRGKGPPDRMPKLVASMRAVLERTRTELQPARLILGGHSMGSRAAAHLAAESPSAIDGVLLLAYPLHPPRKPETTREEVLRGLTLPTLWIAGTRDGFCTAAVDARVRASLPKNVHCVRLESVDHGYAVPKRSGRTQADVLDSIRTAVADWLTNAFA